MNEHVWLLILSLALLTFLLRGSFLLFANKLELPAGFDRVFRYIPAAILASLVGPAFIKNEGMVDYSFSNPYLLAGLVAIAIAWKSKSILITLVTGMLALWLFKSLLF